MIKILTVSDVVDRALYPVVDERLVQDVGLIVSCGDLKPEYLSFLVHTIRVPLFYVSGNHDIRYGTRPPQGGVDLHARLISFKGLRILGLEGSMWYNGGPYQYTEREMRRVIRRLRPAIWWQGGIDLVVTHAPPRGVRDEADLCHQGFECFRWLIRKYKPRYFVHGHIHRSFETPSDRTSMVDGTQVINTYGHTVLEIEIQEPHSKIEKAPEPRPRRGRSQELQ